MFLDIPASSVRVLLSCFSSFQVFDVPRCRTVQFGMKFVPSCVWFWNSLDEPCFAGEGVAAFLSQINRALLFG